MANHPSRILVAAMRRQAKEAGYTVHRDKYGDTSGELCSLWFWRFYDAGSAISISRSRSAFATQRLALQDALLHGCKAGLVTT